jgi:hypothetical protein
MISPPAKEFFPETPYQDEGLYISHTYLSNLRARGGLLKGTFLFLGFFEGIKLQ